MAVTVRRPGVRMAPPTRTIAWRKGGPVKQERNGSNHADISSDQGWTGMVANPTSASPGALRDRHDRNASGGRPHALPSPARDQHAPSDLGYEVCSSFRSSRSGASDRPRGGQ